MLIALGAVLPANARALAAPAATVPAGAAAMPSETTASVSLSEDGQTIYLVGTLAGDSFLAFDALLQRAPRARRVYLASSGGLLLEGRAIAALVRKYRLSTYVEHLCASACTMIFVAGKDRVIGPDARLGFHQASVVDDKGIATGTRLASGRKLTSTQVFGVNGNDWLMLAYDQAGIDRAFSEKALDFKHGDMWYPSVAELSAARVIVRQAAVADYPPPPGSLSLAQVRSRLAALDLWRVGASAFPALNDQAAYSIWRGVNSGITLDTAISAQRPAMIAAMQGQLARSGDKVLEGLLSFYLAAAKSQREQNYPVCTEQSELVDAPLDPARADFEKEEDRLIAAAFVTPAAVPRPDRRQAIEAFAREVIPLTAAAYRQGDGDKPCRLSYRIFEELGSLDPKRRLRIYRAMLAAADQFEPPEQP